MKHVMRTRDNVEFGAESLELYFDADFYNQQAKKKGLEGPLGLDHYLEQGLSFGLDPNPLFSTVWYWRAVQDGTSSTELNPLLHYVASGWKRNHWPSPLFNPGHYRDECRANGRDFDADPLFDFLQYGAANGLSTHHLFDPAWYGDEMQRAGLDRSHASILHYIRVGDKTGLSPHPLFDTRHYKSQVDCGQMPALVHYLLDGWRERVATHALFQTAWYLGQQQLARSAFENGIDAITHYLREGHAHNLSPSPDFDPSWYASLFVDPETWSRSVLEHALIRGERPVQRISRSSVFDFRTGRVARDARVFATAATPLVSIIIVNMNGSLHLPDLFRTLREQTYSFFEIIFVDNASTDGSPEQVEALWADATVVRLDRNANFAEANNIGLEHSRGELLVLLNNDTRVDPNWLFELVMAMRRHPSAAAVTSRVRFWSKFHELRLLGPRPYEIDHRVLERSLNYRKCIINKGHLRGHRLEAMHSEDGFEIILKVPSEEANVCVAASSVDEQTCRLFVGGVLTLQVATTSGEDVQRSIDLSKIPSRRANFVINNAGSYEPGWLTTGDIGFGEFDCGQHSQEREVPLGCGCALMIRRDALHGHLIFAPDFLAYFEDSELSRRFRKDGQSIIYCPTALVYHRHSSTSTEHSRFWLKQVKRNGILYRYNETVPVERQSYLRRQLLDLNHYHHWLKTQTKRTNQEQALLELCPAIKSELEQLCAKIDAKQFLPRGKGRIGIFNSFWNTRGGGEAHALFVANYLARVGTVELLSDRDFDLDDVASYFNVRAKRFIKRVIPELTTALTADYTLFVNAAYMNECPSAAEHSFYIVSFPSRTPTRAFLESYMFLANSQYTRSWIDRLWDGANVKILEPVVADHLLGSSRRGHFAKKRTLLSVGRFFKDGHSKNQLDIVRAFKRVSPRYPDWNLKLAGSIGCQQYFNEVEQAAHGSRVELLPDASSEQISSLYNACSIYVHASGLHMSPEDQPDRFEHFGMTVAEACANGCLPVVYNHAGPADIVNRIGYGYKYADSSSLETELEAAIEQVERHRYNADRIAEAAMIFSAEARESALSDIFSPALQKSFASQEDNAATLMHVS